MKQEKINAMGKYLMKEFFTDDVIFIKSAQVEANGHPALTTLWNVTMRNGEEIIELPVTVSHYRPSPKEVTVNFTNAAGEIEFLEYDLAMAELGEELDHIEYQYMKENKY